MTELLSQCPERFTLVRYASGACSAEQATAIEQHVGGCAPCRAVLDEIDADIADYNALASAEQLARLRSHLATSESQPRARRRWTWYGLPAAAGLAATVLVVFAVTWRERPDGPAVVFKGALGLQVFAERPGVGAQFRVKQGDSMQVGDRLRFVVTTGGPGYLAIFSHDSRGVVSPLYPDTPPANDPLPLWLDGAGAHTLSGSIELDDAPVMEVIIAVFAGQSFSRVEVEAALKRLRLGDENEQSVQQAIGDAASVEVLRLRKVTGP